MKIGITCYPTYGGSGVVATELGIELAAAGHEVHFITYSQPFRLTGPGVGSVARFSCSSFISVLEITKGPGHSTRPRGGGGG